MDINRCGSEPAPGQPVTAECPAGPSAQPASTATSASSSIQPRNTEKAKHLTLLEKIKSHRYGSPMSEDDLPVHNRNVENVHQEIETFVDKFLLADPSAPAEKIRDAIGENMVQILADAGLDLAPYQRKGSGKNAYSKYLLFVGDSLGRPLEGAPLCFQLFRFDPGQKTPDHDHPCECASVVVKGSVRERHYEYRNGRAEKIGKEDRDVNNRRAVDFKGSNLPHSMENRGTEPAYTVHAYHMNGLSKGQTVAVRSIFRPSRNPDSAVYAAYEKLVKRVIEGRDGSDPIPEIAAKNLLAALRENRFGANPVVLDVREPGEWRKSGVLRIPMEGVRVLHVPRGVAVATILHGFPGLDTHFVISCRGGARSALLADELRRLGYAVTSVSDGSNGCAAHGLIEELEGSPDDVHAATSAWREGLAGQLRHAELAKRAATLRERVGAVTLTELMNEIKEDRVVVFDVRQQEEQSDVLPNAQRVPAGVFEKKVRFHADFNQPVVVVSDPAGDGDGGYRALVAAANLREMGYTSVRYLSVSA